MFSTKSVIIIRLTGGRLKRVKEFLNPDENFLFTYGDGVGNIDISSLIEFHKSHGKLATVTAVNPPGRFGMLSINENMEVTKFNEKPQQDSTWINGGYFILHPSVVDFIEHDKISWEEEPLREITSKNELSAFKHSGFWQPMDTLAEKKYFVCALRDTHNVHSTSAPALYMFPAIIVKWHRIITEFWNPWCRLGSMFLNRHRIIAEFWNPRIYSSTETIDVPETVTEKYAVLAPPQKKNQGFVNF